MSDSLFASSKRGISWQEEMLSYELIWLKNHNTYKKVADLFRSRPGALPSDLVESVELTELRNQLFEYFSSESILDIFPRLILNQTHDYPERLRDALHPVELLYYSGNLNLLWKRSIAVIGTRRPSENGLRRTKKLVTGLVERNFIITSGLAEGVDTMAHRTAIQQGGQTIAVIGTPLTEVYPKSNRDLQLEISKNHLLISPVPFLLYSNRDYRSNRSFFPERNKVMSALTEASIIVEASDTSGTLIQAKAALQQNRKLFILDSCFHNKDITWPHKFLEQGAIRVKDFDDIFFNI